MAQELPQPDRNRLGVVMALVLLTYALLRVVVLPSLTAEVRLLGLIVRVEFNTRFVMLTLAAALTIAGADWLIRAHPWLEPGESTREHWVIPGLAALGVGAILARIPEGPAWWLGLLLAAALLAAVLATEFIVVKDEDPRYDGASVGLTALAYLLLVGSLFAIRATGLRATFAIPLFFLASTAVSWRLLHLQQPHTPMWRYAALIGLIIAQLAWGLHYWPVSPLREALVLGLGVYLGMGLALAHERQEFDRGTTIELSSVGAIALAAILILS
jgi:hypothetical protein